MFNSMSISVRASSHKQLGSLSHSLTFRKEVSFSRERKFRVSTNELDRDSQFSVLNRCKRTKNRLHVWYNSGIKDNSVQITVRDKQYTEACYQ